MAEVFRDVEVQHKVKSIVNDRDWSTLFRQEEESILK